MVGQSCMGMPSMHGPVSLIIHQSPYSLSEAPGLRETVLSLMGIMAGQYRYMRDLLNLDRCRPQAEQAPLWPSGPTPISLPALLTFMHCNPDQAFSAYIFEGLSRGFRVGFDRRHPLQCWPRNHPSTDQCPLAKTNRIASEVQQGHLVGPVPEDLLPLVHVSPIGLVPKSHSISFRMIVDLSSPRNYSVNDGIQGEMCSLQYASVDQAVSIILQLGPGTQLANLDLRDAYRMVPVHPHDHPLLGICWEGSTYVDRSLPFGLRSAPKIFTAVADMLAWALHRSGVRYVLHYLDDFLLLGPPGSPEAERALSRTTQTFATLGVPVAEHKTEGPATELSFLGIFIDTDKFQLRLPTVKLTRLRHLLLSWRSRRSCTRTELESFVSHLSHAAIVIRQGRIFLRPLFALLSTATRPQFYIRLNCSVRADLQWWDCFLQDWNGTSFFPKPVPSVHTYSDASSSFGCGAFDADRGWFQFQWSDGWADRSIASKEMIPVVVAAALWGKSWAGHHICFHSDNMAVVSVLTNALQRMITYSVCYGAYSFTPRITNFTTLHYIFLAYTIRQQTNYPAQS